MGHQRLSMGKGGNNRKHGRNKVKCERYRRQGRREFNKARQIRAQRRREAKARAKKAARAAHGGRGMLSNSLILFSPFLFPHPR